MLLPLQQSGFNTIFSVPSGIEFRRLAKDLGHKESGAAVDQEVAFLVKHPTRITLPEGFPPLLDGPTIILGEGNTIVMWYLPGALSNNAQVSITPLLAV